jgi:hypothetical protein
MGGGICFRKTPAVTRASFFSGLTQITAPFSRFLRQARGCGGPTLTGSLWFTAVEHQDCVKLKTKQSPSMLD